MPIYEYACKVCGDSTEVVRSVDKINDPIECAGCGYLVLSPVPVFTPNHGHFAFADGMPSYQDHGGPDSYGEMEDGIE